MKWIPCEERLPNDNREVLISLEWGIDIGTYERGEWRSEWINHYDDDNVLAWMPLPQPYTADRKDEPTISKMEQVDKDINVRSKDEPQYDFGEYADRLWKIAYERGKREALEQTCRWWDGKRCHGIGRQCDYEPKDEPNLSVFPTSSDEPQTEDFQDWKDRMWAEAIVTEPTISKMEQVEDEPQTQLTAKCLGCNNSKACKENHWEGCRYEPLGYEVTAVVGTMKDEPQTERSE